MSVDVDVCMTSLPCPAIHRGVAARRWTMLIMQSEYTEIRDAAETVYREMECRGQLLPLVERHRDGIKMTFSEGKHSVEFQILSGSVDAIAIDAEGEKMLFSIPTGGIATFCKSFAEFLKSEESNAETCDGGGEERRREG